MRRYDVADVFERWPIRKAVRVLSVPAVISQLVTAACSMTDTFFVGQVGTERQIAAVSVSYTAMILLNTIANLFGVGGASLLSRALGAKQPDVARKASTFSLYGAAAMAALYAALMAVIPRELARLFGATDSILQDTCDYLYYCVTWGAVPAVLTMVLGNLTRAEGAVRQAGFGLCLAGVANIVLDPIFIYPAGLGMGVAGAALATALANGLSAAYFLAYLWRSKARSVLSLNPAHFTLERRITLDILSVGFPQAIKTTMSTFSNAVINHLAAPFGDHVIAAFGVAHKFDLLPMNIATGFSSGTLPMIGYTYAAKRYDRMKQTLRSSCLYTLCVALAFMAFYLACADWLAATFVNDAATAVMSAKFLRVMSLAIPGMALSFTLTALFQATGRAKEALILSLYRKGMVDIPLLFVMNALLPMWGIAIVSPIVDTSAMMLAILFYKRFQRTLRDEGRQEPCDAIK